MPTYPCSALEALVEISCGDQFGWAGPISHLTRRYIGSYALPCSLEYRITLKIQIK